MPKTWDKPKTVFDYATVVKDAHTRLLGIEAHLAALVQERRMEASRVIEDEHRIVPAGVEGNPSSVNVVQGEAWVVERVAVTVPGVVSGTVYLYRDTVTPSRLAKACPLDANGLYTDTCHHLYLPERTQLIATYVGVGTPTQIFFNVQIRVLKRHIRPVSSEETYALAGPVTGYDGYNLQQGEGIGTHIHEDRQGDKALQADSLGGNLLPPVPEKEVRPSPHFRIQDAVGHAVKDVVELFDDLV